MPIELFSDGRPKCLMFTDLAEGDDAAVQANQFLVIDGESGALIDPGGNLAFNELFLAVQQHLPPHRLTAILASHADPDIIGSLWERFAPHFCKTGKTAGCIVGIPDAGLRIAVGRHEIRALPIRMIVPQHGAPLVGAAVADFMAWVQVLECGIDHLGPADYALPASPP